MQIAPADLTVYWALSAEMLALLQAVDEHLERWRQSGPAADERARYLTARRRLVALLAKAEEIGIEAEPER